MYLRFNLVSNGHADTKMIFHEGRRLCSQISGNRSHEAPNEKTLGSIRRRRVREDCGPEALFHSVQESEQASLHKFRL